MTTSCIPSLVTRSPWSAPVKPINCWAGERITGKSCCGSRDEVAFASSHTTGDIQIRQGRGSGVFDPVNDNHKIGTAGSETRLHNHLPQPCLNYHSLDCDSVAPLSCHSSTYIFSPLNCDFVTPLNRPSDIPLNCHSVEL